MDPLRRSAPRVRAVHRYISILLAAIPCSVAAAEENSDLKTRFLTEAPRAWVEYQRGVDNFCGSFIESTSGYLPTESNVTTQPKVTRGDLYIDANQYLFRSRRISEAQKQIETHDVANADYLFCVRRELPNGEFRINSFNPLKRSDQQSSLAMRCKWLRVPLTACGMYMLDIMRSEDFQYQRIGPVEYDGRQLVEVQFVTTFQSKPDGRHLTIILDPNYCWLICYCYWEEHIGQYESTMRSIEYAHSDGGVIYPRRVVEERLGNPDSNLDYKLKVEFDAPTPISKSWQTPDAFRMAAYGFEEPSIRTVASPLDLRHVCLIGATAVVLIVATLFLWSTLRSRLE